MKFAPIRKMKLSFLANMKKGVGKEDRTNRSCSAKWCCRRAVCAHMRSPDDDVSTTKKKRVRKHRERHWQADSSLLDSDTQTHTKSRVNSQKTDKLCFFCFCFSFHLTFLWKKEIRNFSWFQKRRISPWASAWCCVCPGFLERKTNKRRRLIDWMERSFKHDSDAANSVPQLPADLPQKGGKRRFDGESPREGMGEVREGRGKERMIEEKVSLRERKKTHGCL